MAEGKGPSGGGIYPLTKMNFIVDKAAGGTAAFSEVTGVEGSVKPIDFRQGNSGSLAPVKVPGLVSHGNVTLKMGYTSSNAWKKWIFDCLSEQRTAIVRDNIRIQIIDTVNANSPQSLGTAVSGDENYWILKNAWVCKYQGPDLNATASDIAIETLEIAYEEITYPAIGGAE
ncbi:MAG: phage tail protein [Oscillospiraceae bacterium]